MRIEADEVRITAGLIHGCSIGSPISIEIGNSEWSDWEQVMSADAVDPAVLIGLSHNRSLTKPRPGHGDLAGMQKYDFASSRPILERASARETAARVAIGEVAKLFLRQAVGIEIVSHVVAIGGIHVELADTVTPQDQATIDADPLRCFDRVASAKMQDLIADVTKDGDTVGGVVEILAWNPPPGLGTHTQADGRLDGQLAAGLMSIPAVKAVEIGDGFALAAVRGSAAHDQMHQQDNRIERISNRAGGIEGGISNGETIKVRVAIKPIPTLGRALATVNLATGQDDVADYQRSDVCAVPAAGVVAEAMMALVLANGCLEKFGGDTVDDIRAGLGHYQARLRAAGLEGCWQTSY